jgi:hypothetical protein
MQTDRQTDPIHSKNGGVFITACTVSARWKWTPQWQQSAKLVKHDRSEFTPKYNLSDIFAKLYYSRSLNISCSIHEQAAHHNYGLCRVDAHQSVSCNEHPQNSCTDRNICAGLDKYRATKFATVTPNICGSSMRNLFHVTLLGPRILTWLLDGCTVSVPLT